MVTIYRYKKILHKKKKEKHKLYFYKTFSHRKNSNASVKIKENFCKMNFRSYDWGWGLIAKVNQVSYS